MRGQLTALLVVSLSLLPACADDSHPPYHGSGLPPRPPVVRPVDAAVPDTGIDALTPDVALLPDGPQGCGVDPGSIRITGGDVNGNILTAGAPTASVGAGVNLSGSLSLQIDRKDSCAGCGFAVVMVGSWEDAQVDGVCVATGATSGPLVVTALNTLAPSALGTYYLMIAGRVSHSCDEVLSGSTGTAVFGDGNDLSDWPAAAISEAATTGNACVDWFDGTQVVKARVPAAVVTIQVQ